MRGQTTVWLGHDYMAISGQQHRGFRSGPAMTSATEELRLAADFAPATYEDWRKLVDVALKGAPFEKLVGKTYDGLTIEPIYPRARGATPVAGRPAPTQPNSEEWLAHRGTVGKVLLGDLHILDENMQPCPVGTPGTVWFKTATPFEYFNDPNKTREARSPDGTMSTVGDVGYVDNDGYLYLTDRATFMIISGGVNIYPQECENLLITHPKIADAAVFGVPNPDLGEEVKAVVQPMPGVTPGPDLAEELIAFCAKSLSRQKVPRSVDFEAELPRLPTGKLYKRLLRDRYWGNKTSRIV